MSDFGAVYDYALMLEASIPEADLTKFEAMRPACMGVPGKRNPEPPPPPKAELEAKTQSEWQAARAAPAGAPAATATPSTPPPHTTSHPAPAADDKKK